MKILKFNHELVEPMLNGEKTTTWRLFDEKNLQTGDAISCVDAETGTQFAVAEIISVREKKLGDIEAADYQGHEMYGGRDELLAWYQKHYGDAVTFETPVKIIGFQLITP